MPNINFYKIKDVLNERIAYFDGQRYEVWKILFADNSTREEYLLPDKKHGYGCSLGLDGQPVLFGETLLSSMMCECKVDTSVITAMRVHKLNELRDEMREMSPEKFQEIYRKLAPGSEYIGIIERINMQH